jgi:hypothetical protein
MRNISGDLFGHILCSMGWIEKGVASNTLGVAGQILLVLCAIKPLVSFQSFLKPLLSLLMTIVSEEIPTTLTTTA